MLSRNKNVVDTDNLKLLALFIGVLNDDLRLAIGSEPRNSTRVSCLCHFFAEEVGKVVRIGMESNRVPLIGSIAEHNTLITSTKVIHFLGNVDSLSNLGALSLDVNKNGHGLVVETLILLIITNLSANVSGNLLEVDGGAVNEGLTEETDHLCLGSSLEAKLAVLVLTKALIEDTIRNLIAKLVRVALTDGLGGEVEIARSSTFHLY
jgi:hypothetical protein